MKFELLGERYELYERRIADLELLVEELRAEIRRLKQDETE